jgi:hypothetical protein
MKANNNLILIGVKSIFGDLLFFALKLLYHIPMDALYELIEIFMVDIYAQVAMFPFSPHPYHPPHTPYRTPWLH